MRTVFGLSILLVVFFSTAQATNTDDELKDRINKISKASQTENVREVKTLLYLLDQKRYLSVVGIAHKSARLKVACETSDVYTLDGLPASASSGPKLKVKDDCQFGMAYLENTGFNKIPYSEVSSYLALQDKTANAKPASSSLLTEQMEQLKKLSTFVPSQKKWFDERLGVMAQSIQDAKTKEAVLVKDHADKIKAEQAQQDAERKAEEESAAAVAQENATNAKIAAEKKAARDQRLNASACKVAKLKAAYCANQNAISVYQKQIDHEKAIEKETGTINTYTVHNAASIKITLTEKNQDITSQLGQLGDKPPTSCGDITATKKTACGE